MLRLPDEIKSADLNAQMLIQVHDELVFECPEGELKPTTQLVKQVMSNAFKLCIPLKTDAKAGRNWAEMRSMD
jgi:DNA polymerase-1